MDRELGVEVEQQGPVGRRLEELGPVIPLVFGGFGEVSEGVHDLISTLAQVRLSKEGLVSGWFGTEGRMGVIKGDIRRRLSLATVRANTNCMLARLCQVGERARDAGKRRRLQQLEEEKMRLFREATWRAKVTGHSIQQRGQFLLE